VSAPRADAPLTAELDETELWRSGTADGESRYRNARAGALVPMGGALSRVPRGQGPSTGGCRMKQLDALPAASG
jgi:hypothetical protein